MNLGQRSCRSQPGRAALFESVRQITQFRPLACNPQCEDRRQAGHGVPGLAQVDDVVEWLARYLHRPIANHEHGIGGALECRDPQGQFLDLVRAHPMRAIQPDPCQYLARPRPRIQRHPPDPLPGHPAE